MAIDLNAKPPTANQADLAELIGVDRTTIRAYAKAGMPCTPKTKGRENNYVIPLCVNWVAGYQAARENGLPMMNTLELVLLGFTTAFQNASFQEYRSEAAGIAATAGASDREFDEAVGFLRGAKLLPRSW
jgi:phage terminase Nu1 subunit (DNA packaging protein)